MTTLMTETNETDQIRALNYAVADILREELERQGRKLKVLADRLGDPALTDNGRLTAFRRSLGYDKYRRSEIPLVFAAQLAEELGLTFSQVWEEAKSRTL